MDFRIPLIKILSCVLLKIYFSSICINPELELIVDTIEGNKETNIKRNILLSFCLNS